MAKADNLLNVLWLLRSRRRMTAEQIAEALEVNVRTVYRYIDALSASGVPIIADAGHAGGYSLPDSFKGAPLFFEPQELVALFQAALFARSAGHPYSAALETALAKVERNLNPEQRHELARQAGALAVAPGVRGGPVEPWLSLLQEAVAASATVELRYRKPGAEEAEQRVVDPFGLAYRSGYWYLVGWCHMRQALRDFRVDRVEGLARTGGRFERPEGFRIQEAFADDWVLEQVRTGEPVTVRLEGEPGAIEAVAGHWYLRHCLAERSGRAVTLRVDPVGRRHLPGYLLAFGTRLAVAEPDDLRAELAGLAQALAEYHQVP